MGVSALLVHDLKTLNLMSVLFTLIHDQTNTFILSGIIQILYISFNAN